MVQLVATVLVVINELPALLGNDGRWFAPLIAVVRIMPEQRALGDRIALEQRHQAHAVNVLLGRDLHAGEFQQRGIPVNPAHRHIAGSAGFGHRRSVDVERFADAALPLPPLAAAQWQVAGREGIAGRDAAVV